VASLIPAQLSAKWEVHEWRNALAILNTVHPREWKDIVAVLSAFTLTKSAIAAPGGRKTSNIAGAIDQAFYDRGWEERNFETAVVVDGVEHPSPTHKVDCFKGKVALEMEWNNKDPFFDRDLNNFRLLFELRTVEVGVIVTRSDELQAIFDSLDKGKSYGASTTHMSKLLPKIEGGGGGGCPIVALGMTVRCYDSSR